MDIGKVPAALFAPGRIGIEGPAAVPLAQDGLAPSFSDALKNAVYATNDKAIEADSQVQKLMLGEGSIHQAMIAMQDAAVSMDMVMAVRNKILEAYQEVMRMPV